MTKPTTSRILAIFITALCLFTSLSCSPDYKEGPDFSIYSVRYKIKNKWKWDYAFEKLENTTGKKVGHTIEFTDEKVSICDENNNCVEGYWTLVGKKKDLINFVYPEKDSAKELFIIRMNKNNMTLVSSEARNTKDTTYVRWDLKSVKKRWP